MCEGDFCPWGVLPGGLWPQGLLVVDFLRPRTSRSSINTFLLDAVDWALGSAQWWFRAGPGQLAPSGPPSLLGRGVDLSSLWGTVVSA